MMALKASLTQLLTQRHNQNKTIEEEAKGVMQQGTMKLGKKTLKHLARWGRRRIEVTGEIEAD